MLQQKKLAFSVEDKKSERKKSLFFATVASLAASIMLSCGPAHALPPAKAPTSIAKPAPKKAERACEPNLKGVLEKGEKVLDRKCAEGREFVLTNRSLIIMTDRMPIIDDDGNIIVPRFSRTDMGDILKRGLAGWEASGKACYFLTDDRALIVLPNGDMGDTVPEYEIPFETKGIRKDRMAYLSSTLLIAPDERRILAMAGSVDLKATMVRLGPGNPDAGFYRFEGKLFFGKDGDSVEIKIEEGGVVLIKKEKK